MQSFALTNTTTGSGTNSGRAAAVHTKAPTDVWEMIHNTARGTHVPKGGGAPVTTMPKPVPFLMHYKRGAIGFMQWYAKAYPQLFKLMQKHRPDLIKAAAAPTTAGVQACPGVSQQLGALGSGSSWYSSILNWTGQALDLYGKYKAITSGQTTQQVQNQVQRQVQNAQSNLPPQQLGPVDPNAPAPSPKAVTSGSGHSGLLMFGGLGLGGLALAKVFHLF